jgi:1-phosphofructokinase family hexose kinase
VSIDALQPKHPVFIACPNLSLDRTIEVPSLGIGQVHRALRSDGRGGGKGVNVARALKCLGLRSLVLGIAGGRTGETVEHLLQDEGIEHVCVRCDDETRSCLIVLAQGTATVFNEAGPSLDRETWNRYRSKVVRRLNEGAIFVSAGSFPPGAPADAAARLVEVASAKSCFTICDTSGEQLEHVLEAAPDLITPNLAEAEALLRGSRGEAVHVGEDALDRAATSAQALVHRGYKAALVTAGEAGAALARVARVECFISPQIELQNPVGAGDCLVAGIALGMASSLDLTSAVRCGVAMGAASCETFYAGLLDPRRAGELEQHVRQTSRASG